MSWHATKAAWRAPVKGGEKLVLLAIAFFVPPPPKDAHLPLTMTPPLDLKDLHTMTGLKERQLRTLRARLERRGQIRCHREDGHGKRVAYEFVGMLGALWVATATDAEGRARDVAKNAATSRQRVPRARRTSRQEMPRSTADDLPDLTNGTSSRSPVDSSHTQGATGAAANLALRGIVTEFLEWFVAAYATSVGSGGATYSYQNGYEQDAAKVFALLRGEGKSPPRTVERLKAMALAMFTLEPDDDPQSDASYIARYRNIHVLHKKANELDRLVAGDSPASMRGRSTPSQADAVLDPSETLALALRQRMIDGLRALSMTRGHAEAYVSRCDVVIAATCVRIRVGFGQAVLGSYREAFEAAVGNLLPGRALEILGVGETSSEVAG